MVDRVGRARLNVTEDCINTAGQVLGGMPDMRLTSGQLVRGLTIMSEMHPVSMTMRSGGDITGVAGDENQRKCVERRQRGGELAIRGDVEAVGHEEDDAKLRKIECHNGFI